MKKNKEFIKYVEKKILKRLALLAEFNKHIVENDQLMTKGEYIFTKAESDRK